MCLSREEATERLLAWGQWHFRHGHFDAGLGFSSDGICSIHRLSVPGGGGEVDDCVMPDDVRRTDELLKRLEEPFFELARMIFIRADIGLVAMLKEGKYCFMSSKNKSANQFRSILLRFWDKTTTVLDVEFDKHPCFRVDGF